MRGNIKQNSQYHELQQFVLVKVTNGTHAAEVYIGGKGIGNRYGNRKLLAIVFIMRNMIFCE